jgi:hypothetical protein
MVGGVGSNREVEMREIGAFAVAALILIGVGSFGSDVSAVREAAASTEAGINTTVVPAVPDGIDPFALMASARDLPTTHYDRWRGTHAAAWK